MLTEVVYDLDEFLSLLAKPARIHHEFYWKILDKSLGFPVKIEAGIVFYGVSREGHILKCELHKTIDWKSDELNKYEGSTIEERFGNWIQECWEEFYKKAKGIGSTPGKFEVLPVLSELSGRN